MTADFTSCTQHGDLGWKYMGMYFLKFTCQVGVFASGNFARRSSPLERKTWPSHATVESRASPSGSGRDARVSVSSGSGFLSGGSLKRFAASAPGLRSKSGLWVSAGSDQSPAPLAPKL